MLSFARLRTELQNQNPSAQLPDNLIWTFEGYLYSSDDTELKTGQFTVNGAPDKLYQLQEDIGGGRDPNVGFETENGLGIYRFQAIDNNLSTNNAFEVTIKVHSVWRFDDQSIFTMVDTSTGRTEPWLWTEIL